MGHVRALLPMLVFGVFLAGTSGCSVGSEGAPPSGPDAPAPAVAASAPAEPPEATAIVPESQSPPPPAAPSVFVPLISGPAQLTRAPTLARISALSAGDCVNLRGRDAAGDLVIDLVACEGAWETLIVRSFQGVGGAFVGPAWLRATEVCHELQAEQILSTDEATWAGGDQSLACGIPRYLLAPPTRGDCYLGNVSNHAQFALGSCGDPHNYEAVVGIPDRRAAPGPIPAEVGSQCLRAAQVYVGGTPTVRLGVDIFAPSPATWSYGDRTFRCYVSNRDASLIDGVLRDAFRR